MHEDIDICRVNFGELAIWWFGRHRLIVKAGETFIYPDPLLSAKPERKGAPLLTPEIFTHADDIAGSHDHEDDHVSDYAACFVYRG